MVRTVMILVVIVNTTIDTGVSGISGLAESRSRIHFVPPN